MTTAPRNTRGQLECEQCGGEGTVEVQLPARSSAQLERTHALETCEACEGSRVRRCAACAAPATVIGENGGQAYCDIGHAWADGNWPSCVICQTRPQHAALAPFCGDDCQGRFEYRVVATSRSALADGRV